MVEACLRAAAVLHDRHLVDHERQGKFAIHIILRHACKCVRCKCPSRSCYSARFTPKTFAVNRSRMAGDATKDVGICPIFLSITMRRCLMLLANHRQAATFIGHALVGCGHHAFPCHSTGTLCNSLMRRYHICLPSYFSSHVVSPYTVSANIGCPICVSSA